MRNGAILSVLALFLFAINLQPSEPQEPADVFPWDWAGAFELQPGDYLAVFSGAISDNPSEAANMVLIRTDTTGLEGIENISAEVRDIFDTEPVTAPGGKGIVIVPGKILYELPLEEGRNTTEYLIRIDKNGTCVLFLSPHPLRSMPDICLFTARGGRKVRPSVEQSY